MPVDLLVANAAPALSIALPTVVAITSLVITVLLALIAVMVGLAAWAGKREIARNDDAHRDLRASIDTSRRELRSDIKVVEADVKRLLTSQARIEATLATWAGKRASRPEEDPSSLKEVGPEPSTTH